jgi:hypothetical protein
MAKKIQTTATKTAPKSMMRSDLIIVIGGAVLAMICGWFYFASKGSQETMTSNLVETPVTESSSLADAFADSLSSVPKGANSEGKPREAVKDCLDRHKECIDFKKNGECLKNPGWMIINCPRSCDPIIDSCRLRDPKIRCDRKNLNISTEPVYQPGDMDAMFKSLEARYKNRHNVQILSRSPWVALFENFISDDEIKALVSTIPKFERSTDSGQMNDFGEVGRILSQGRTSSNGWCGADCLKVSFFIFFQFSVFSFPSLNLSYLFLNSLTFSFL